ncbi:MAG: cysteine desulfurase family protein [Planctomycetaceae bacterium]
MPERAPPIYLDNNATTPVDPRVRDAMLPYLGERFGNASSRSHRYGWEAEEAVEEARKQVAALLGADPREIVFTSGATESNNLALKGLAEAWEGGGGRSLPRPAGEAPARVGRAAAPAGHSQDVPPAGDDSSGRRRAPGGGGHIISSPTEHPSVLDTLAYLERRGFAVTLVPVDAFGRVSPEAVERALRPDTFLVSLMAANNEIGTLHPVREIGALCARRGVLFHTDATQALGKVPFDVQREGVHLASLTAHKMYGPKGSGALYVRRRDPEVRLALQMHGGGHERGMRSGTLGVPGIVGLGKACALAASEREAEAPRCAALRDMLLARLRDAIPDLHRNGHASGCLPGNLNVSIPGVESEALMLALPELAISSGAACSSGSLEPSGTLKAIGLAPELARCPVRFGIGRFSSAGEVERAASLVTAAVARLRAGARRGARSR